MLGSESPRLLLLEETEMSNHTLDLIVEFEVVSVKDGDGIDTIGACRHTKGFLSFEVTFDFGEQLVV